jgi:hypothetical protein
VPLRRVLGRAIKPDVVEIDSGSYCQGGCGFLETGQKRINLASGLDSIHGRCGRCGRQSSHWNSWFWVYQYLTGRSGLDSLRAWQGQIWVRFILCRQIRSGFTPCLAGRSSYWDGKVAVRCRRQVGHTTGGVAVVGRSQACDTVNCRASQVLRALEALKQVCLTRVDLASVFTTLAMVAG